MSAKLIGITLLLLIVISTLGCDVNQKASNEPGNSAQVVPSNIPSTTSPQVATPTNLPILPTPVGSLSSQLLPHGILVFQHQEKL